MHRLRGRVHRPEAVRTVVSAYRIGDEPHAAVLAAVPGDAAALAELVRGRYAGARRFRDVRDLAALLAESLPVHRLLPLFGHPPSGPDTWAELIACLTQELVVRGVTLTRVPGAVRCAAVLGELGHPLAGLPLRLGRGERGMRAPFFLSDWTPRHERHVAEHPEAVRLLGEPAGEGNFGEEYARGDHAGTEPVIVSTAEDERLATAAVGHWSSPGWAGTIAFPGPLAPGDLVPVGVNAFLRGPRWTGIVLGGWHGDLAGVVGELFTAAYCDASYAPGLRGGYGRLAAWRSVAGLVRAPSGASVHRVNELAARWRWLVFGIGRRDPYWTHRELAVGALGPRGDVLSLLVSHDTD